MVFGCGGDRRSHCQLAHGKDSSNVIVENGKYFDSYYTTTIQIFALATRPHLRSQTRGGRVPAFAGMTIPFSLSRWATFPVDSTL